MSFLYPHVLWALFLPLLIAAGAAWRHRRSGSAWRKLVSPAHERELVTRRAPWQRALGGSCGVLALALLLVAAARPINGYREAEATASSRNILLALDISRSMETQDVTPSRLEEARAAAYELIDALPEDKIGLIVFSGEADLVVPLTYDHTALRDALEQVDRSWAGTGGTDFNKVLRKAMQDFSRSAPEGSNALVLLSDGEDTTNDSRSLTDEAKEKHLLVIAVGIGTEAGAPIPDPEGDNGLWVDADGKHVISKLDTESLRRFAKETDGDYVAMNSQTDLAAFARRAVRHINRHEEEFSLNKVPNDCFAPFAGAALVLLVLSILCSTEWRLPRRAPLPLLLALALCGALRAEAAPRAEALEHYRMGLQAMQTNREEAKGLFSEALLDSDRQLQAAALYEIGNTNTEATFTKLRELYAAPEPSDDDPDTPAATQQGVSKQALQQIVDTLKEDISSYDAALKLNPQLQQAASNKSKVQELIRVLEEELKREDPPSDNQEQDNQQQDNADQGQDGQDNQQQDNADQGQDGQDNQQQDNADQGQDGQDNQQQDNADQEQDGQDNQQQDNADQGQDGQDNQQKDNSDQGQDKQQQSDGDKEQQNQQQPTPEQQGDKDEPQQAPETDGLSEKEKAEQRAASILQMHLDEEHGSPIPHAELPVRPPKKDY